jgi:hypothetical protein
MKKGDKVTITIKAGLVSADDDTRFVESCEPGTVGVYLGRHPNKRLKDWHLVTVGELRAPLHRSQFKSL